MIKKAVSFSIVMLIVFLIYQTAITFIKRSHNITYTIDDISFEEHYVRNTDDMYVIDAKVNDKDYIFSVKNEFNKQRQIVSDTKIYESEGATCVSLKLKNKKYTFPVCYIGDSQVSYSYIPRTEEFTEYLNSLKGLDYNKYGENPAIPEDGAGHFIQNFQPNEILTLYNYKNIILFTNKENKSYRFSDYDIYKNDLGIIVDRYYMVPKYGSGPGFNMYIKYDLEYLKEDFIRMPFEISKTNTYINGVYKDDLYIFDRSAMMQYKIDVKGNIAEKSCDTANQCFAYIAGKELTISTYDLATKDIRFYESSDDYSDVQYDSILVKDNYAIYSVGTSVYKVYKLFPNNPILLFDGSGIKDLKVVNDSIYYLKDSVIYRYDDYGSRMLVYYTDLEFNSENRFDVYLK